MGEERSSIAAKAVALKKAGMPTAATVLILALSTPGFYEFFLNKTDDEAVAKAEVAYEILKERSNAQARELDRLSSELRELRLFLMRDMYGVEGAMEEAAEAAEEEMPSEDAMGERPVELMSPEELFVGSVGVQVHQEQMALPDSLDDESLADKIKAKVSEK